MKIKIVLFILLAAAAKAEPAFVGLLVDGARRAIYAVVLSPGQAAQWVKVGDTADGYTVAEYLPKTDTLVLEKDNTKFLLKLKTAKIIDSSIVEAEAAKRIEEDWLASEKLIQLEVRLKRLKEERAAALKAVSEQRK